MFDKFSIDKRFRKLEDTIIQLSEDISDVRMQLATIRGKMAVTTRDEQKKDPNKKLMSLVKDLLGGEPIAIYDPSDNSRTDDSTGKDIRPRNGDRNDSPG